MRMHIQTRGPRCLEVCIRHDGGEHQVRRHIHEAISPILTKLDAQGGRFMVLHREPLDQNKYDSALVIIDNLQDLSPPPLFQRLHRLVHLHARDKGVVVESPEPPTLPGSHDTTEP